jgi:outer membrane lipoprotein-sorting protein
VTIAVSRETGMLRRLAIVEESGQRRTLVLTALAPNAPVPPREVRFEVPRGVKVVTP